MFPRMNVLHCTCLKFAKVQAVTVEQIKDKIISIFQCSFAYVKELETFLGFKLRRIKVNNCSQCVREIILSCDAYFEEL